MMSNMVDMSPVVYMDSSLMVAGSGFVAGESIEVFIATSEGSGPALGFADADAGGAWALLVQSSKFEGRVFQLASGQLLSAPALSLMAVGSVGSKASTPVRAMANAPEETAPAAPQAPSLMVIVQERDYVILGAGFRPGENVSFLAVSGPDEKTLITSAVAADNGAVTKELAVRALPLLGLDTGVYTLEGFGSEGSLATAPLVVK